MAEGHKRADTVKSNRLHDTDTGSPEVQIALLTERLETLNIHFKSHPKDIHSQRGMKGIIARRKKLLSYLRNEDVNRYRKTLNALGLRK